MWIVILVLVLSVSPIHAQLETHTNGSSGDPCPEKRCLAGRAQCMNDRCVCDPPFVLHPNNGHFGCYRNTEPTYHFSMILPPDQVFAEIKNDPAIRNFNNEAVNFPFPCRYLVTNVTTNLRILKQIQGSCTCQIHAWNSKIRGKFYVGGFDAACLITNMVLNETLGFSVRKEGTADNGHFTYREYALNDYQPDGPWTIAQTNFTGAGVNIHCKYDLENNQARLDVPACGLGITFVAYDLTERRNQDQIPGLSVAVNCGNDPVFNDGDTAMAAAPARFGGMPYRDLADPPLTIQEVLLVRAFRAQVAQNQPGAAEQCWYLHEYLNRCRRTDFVRAVKQCFWMFNEPHFLRCIDNGMDTNSFLVLLEYCIESRCMGYSSCRDFGDILIQTKCGNVTGIPELRRIVNGDDCSQ